MRCALGLLLLFALRAIAADLSPDEIVRRADEARGPQGTYSFRAKVEDLNDGKVSAETTYKVYSKDLDLVLIETVAPARLKGRKLLMRGNDLWSYMPTIKRPIRVGFQQRLTGEVSNGDIARTNFAKDYDAKLEGTETVKGRSCYKLGLTAKHKEVTYRSLTYWVEKGTCNPVKADFYALSGKLLKSGEYSHPETVLGKTRLTDMLITDALHPSRQSRLHCFDYRREKLDDSFFNKESLAE
jgi:hypothetical protein